jgi:hypothetical protein
MSPVNLVPSQANPFHIVITFKIPVRSSRMLLTLLGLLPSGFVNSNPTYCIAASRLHFTETNFSLLLIKNNENVPNEGLKTIQFYSLYYIRSSLLGELLVNKPIV